MSTTATDLAGRLSALPAGARLLDVVDGHPGVALVGGAVRDLLLGRTPRELDLVVQEEVEPFARDLARRLGVPEPTVHERFGTATLEGEDLRIDIGRARAERYSAPGALPEVRPGTWAEDLARRDFTVNAIALTLDDLELRCAPDALDDLAATRLRVMHEQSFRDDPTRLLRLARYAARLGFTVEPRTEQLARAAIAAGALDSVSGARLGAELRLVLRESDPLLALGELERLGALDALQPTLLLDPALTRSALALLPLDGRPDLLVLAALSLPFASPERARTHAVSPPAPLRAWLDQLEFTAADREVVIAAAMRAHVLAGALARARRPSELRAAIARGSLEAIALAGALGNEHARSGAARWLGDLRHVGLLITGDDLLGAGLAPGPEIGRRLERTLDQRLDGRLPADRRAELRAALR